MREHFLSLIILYTLLLLSPSLLLSQETVLTSTVTGTVVDEEGEPLSALIKVLRTDPVVGAAVDADGHFSLKVPVGQQVLQIISMGYETKDIDIIVRAGRTEELTITLRSTYTTLEGVTVQQSLRKNEPLDPLSFAGARSFSTEETFRFAGSLGDPARMVRAFAGVMPANDNRNDLIIRGNSPLGVQYRINGFEVPNPNHFNAGVGMTGGQVTMLNTNMMENSDFHLGAWPAAFGNALSGIFDIRYYSGTRSVTQTYIQAGYNGLEAGIEGPIGKVRKGSYKVGYRYSIPDLMDKMGIKMIAAPKYQDLTLTAEYDLSRKHSLQALGILGMSKIYIDWTVPAEPKEDEPYSGQLVDLRSYTAFGGLMHKWQIDSRTRLESRLSYAYSKVYMPINIYSDEQPEPSKVFEENTLEGTTSLSSTLTKSIRDRHRITAGLKYDHIDGRYYTIDAPDTPPSIDDDIRLNLIRGFAQYAYTVGPRASLTAGLHSMYLAENGSYSIEPRGGLKYHPALNHTVALAGGLYAQVQNHTFYFIKTELPDGSSAMTNHDLDFSKSAQVSLSYDWSFAPHWNLKVEGYYQHLYDIPVKSARGEMFSVLNLGGNENAIIREDSLVNRGLGRNYGVELTLERYLADHFYLLFTTTLYRTLYTNGWDNGMWIPTAFDGKYIFSLSTGYEWTLPKGWDLFTDLQVNYAGGVRYTPYDVERSMQEDEVFFDWSRPYEEHYPDYARINLRLGFRHNRQKWSEDWGLELQNLTNRKNIMYYDLNTKTGEISAQSYMGFTPMVTYRVYFNL